MQENEREKVNEGQCKVKKFYKESFLCYYKEETSYVSLVI